MNEREVPLPRLLTESKPRGVIVKVRPLTNPIVPGTVYDHGVPCAVTGVYVDALTHCANDPLQ